MPAYILKTVKQSFLKTVKQSMCIILIGKLLNFKSYFFYINFNPIITSQGDSKERTANTFYLLNKIFYIIDPCIIIQVGLNYSFVSWR